MTGTITISDIVLNRAAVLKAVKADREMLEAIKAVSEAHTVPLVEGRPGQQDGRDNLAAAGDSVLTLGRRPLTEQQRRSGKAVDEALTL